MSDDAAGGKGSICGFSQRTKITCTAQAKNSLDFGAAVEGNISTRTAATQSENNSKLSLVYNI